MRLIPLSLEFLTVDATAIPEYLESRPLKIKMRGHAV